MSRHRKGFSLIEICIAIALLAIILGFMLRIFSQGYRYLRKTRMRTIACFLAQEEMEEKSVWPPTAEGLAAVPNFPDFNRQVAVAAFDLCIPPAACPYGNLDVVTVTVDWLGEDGQIKSLTLRTMITNF